MKISVTGATGFIGRHVLNELTRQDVEVNAVTRKTTPIPSRIGSAKGGYWK
jgi:uncharacterized protein YbjT (DUF2867 family)